MTPRAMLEDPFTTTNSIYILIITNDLRLYYKYSLESFSRKQVYEVIA